MIEQDYIHTDLSESEDKLLNNKLAIFNPDCPEIGNMEKQAYEYIQLSGAESLVYLRVNDLGVQDEVWEEESKVLYDMPVMVKGQFVPDPLRTSLKKWGVDTDAKFKINYSRAELITRFGVRLIRSGDVIEIPHGSLIQTQNTEYIDGLIGRADKFRVVNAYDAGNYNYSTWLYWVCVIELLSGDISIRPQD
jgi:hypothetical protein